MSNDVSTSSARRVQAEKRFKEIALGAQGVPIIKIERASLDVAETVSFMVHIPSDDSGVVVFPLRICNSALAAQRFRDENVRMLNLGGIVIVVHNNRTDDDIKADLVRHIEAKLRCGIDSPRYNSLVARHLSKVSDSQKQAKEVVRSAKEDGRGSARRIVEKEVGKLPPRCRIHDLGQYIRRHAFI